MKCPAKNISTFSRQEVGLFFKNAQLFKKRREFTCLMSPKQQDCARILVITSRATGNSPERNLARRRLKALFYENKLYEKNFDYAVIFKPKAARISFDRLKQLVSEMQ